MSQIDWSKAPEGATHYMPEGTAWTEGFWKKDEGNYFYSNGEWKFSHADPFRTDRLVARHSEWSGDGLPPVGTVCELLWCSTSGRYVGVIILAHDEAGAVYRFTDGEKKGDYGSEHQGMIGEFCNFRPIRTPEQIAAEEREHAVQKMMDDTTVLSGIHHNRRLLCAELYDAGYRKQEKQP